MILIKHLLPSGMLVLIEAENDREVILNSIIDTYKDSPSTRDMFLKSFNEN